jgi:tetratricopeptide (TPR) repeat protein
MLKIANLHKLLGDNKKAVSFYDKIIELDKDCTDAYFNKGLVYANAKDYPEAEKCFEKVIELSPDNPYAYYSLALTHELQSNVQKALEYYYLYVGLESDEKMLSIVNKKIKQLEANKD